MICVEVVETTVAVYVLGEIGISPVSLLQDRHRQLRTAQTVEGNGCGEEVRVDILSIDFYRPHVMVECSVITPCGLCTVAFARMPIKQEILERYLSSRD